MKKMIGRVKTGRVGYVVTVNTEKVLTLHD